MRVVELRVLIVETYPTTIISRNINDCTSLSVEALLNRYIASLPLYLPRLFNSKNTSGNKICWNVVIQLGIAEFADDQFRSSEWVSEQNRGMMDSIRHFKTLYGTLGDPFDVTPIEGVSKVYFEDMLFETWTLGRAVLIGDGTCLCS